MSGTNETSNLTNMLEFVQFVKQEEGLPAHQADLYTIGASLVGLISSIRERNKDDMTSEHIAICLGLLDLVNWITKRMNEVSDGQPKDLGQS